MPAAVRELIDAWRGGGTAPQPPTTWPRQRWLDAFPEHADVVRVLPDALDREAVRRACRDASVDPEAATVAFVTVMVWGYDIVGFGPYRTRRALATPGAPDRLVRAVRTLAGEGPLAAYRRLARTDDGKLDGLGPALATKVLYFCQPRPTDMTALILDDLVAFWLDCKVTFRLEPVSWSARNQRRTLGSANDLGARPVGRAGGGVKPAGLQMAGQPLTLGLKSAYTPLGFASQTQAWRM